MLLLTLNLWWVFQPGEYGMVIIFLVDTFTHIWETEHFVAWIPWSYVRSLL